MNSKSFSSMHILLAFFMTKFFILHTIIAPYLFQNFSKFANLFLLAICILQFPLFLFSYQIIKKYNLKNINLIIKENHSKPFYYSIKFLLYVYFIIISIFGTYLCILFISSYVTKNSPVTFILIALMIITIFLVARLKKVLFSLSVFTFLIFLAVLIFVLISNMEFNDYSFSLILKNKNYFLLIILSLHILFLPSLLLNLSDLNKTQFSFKQIVIMGFIFTLADAAIIFRQGNLLGTLVDFLPFPLFETMRASKFNGFFINSDVIFIIYIMSFTVFSISYLFFNAEYNYEIKNRIMKLFILIIPFGFTYLIHQNLSFFKMIEYPLLIISSLIIIYVFISMFIILRGNKNVQ